MESSKIYGWYTLMDFFVIVVKEEQIIGVVIMCCNDLDSLIVKFIDTSLGKGTNLVRLEFTDAKPAQAVVFLPIIVDHINCILINTNIDDNAPVPF